MRTVFLLSLGLVSIVFAAPTGASELADYKATSGQFTVENGVRVYRILSVKQQVNQNQPEVRVSEINNSELSYERGYKQGINAALNRRPKRTRRSLKRRQTGRNLYNYGRRYSTSGFNPRFNRFRSNISYSRPAYLALGKKN